ncbi:hypothetical protein H1C71_014891 [Ictidomys tridecemlineatus]|nr:hypothetical protein H1C71_014891 [Ictidomys tridecemlineatus]
MKVAQLKYAQDTGPQQEHRLFPGLQMLLKTMSTGNSSDHNFEDHHLRPETNKTRLALSSSHTRMLNSNCSQEKSEPWKNPSQTQRSVLPHIKITEMLALPRVTLLGGQGGVSLRPRSSRPAKATQGDPVSHKQNK